MQWATISGITEPIPIRQFQGIYYPEDTGFNLNESYFVELENFSADEFPSMSTRKGFTTIADLGSKVIGLGKYKDEQLLIITEDGKLHKYDSALTEISSGLDTNKEYTFCHFEGNLGSIHVLMSNGAQNMWKYNGTTLSVYSDPPDYADFITTHSNRLYCAKDNSLFYSALNKANDWTTAAEAGEIVVNTTDGEMITGLGAGIGHLTVFKPSTLFELYGKGPSSYSLEQIATDLGAINNKAIVSYDESVMFVGRNGIYTYAGGLRPTKEWTAPIQKITHNITGNMVCACYDGKNLYINLSDKLLQYNIQTGTWFTWEDLDIVQMVMYQNQLIIGTSDGRVLRLDSVKDDNRPIKSLAITKPFTSDSTARKQHWFKLWIVSSMTQGSKIKVSLSNNDTWIVAKEFTAARNIEFQEILVPLNTVADAHYVQIKLETEGKVTIHEITRQLRHMPMRR